MEDNEFDVVREPALVLASATGSYRSIDTDFSGSTGAIYEVYLKIDDVVAGKMINRNQDLVKVRLQIGNVGHLTRGHKILVLLEPLNISENLPLKWRLISEFSCFNASDIERLKIDFNSAEKFRIGNDFCVY